MEVNGDAPQRVHRHRGRGTSAAVEQPAAAGVSHLVNLGHVDQLHDRLAGRRGRTLVGNHWSDPPSPPPGGPPSPPRPRPPPPPMPPRPPPKFRIRSAACWIH